MLRKEFCLLKNNSGGQLISGYTLLKCLPLIMSTRKKKHSELHSNYSEGSYIYIYI